MNRLLITGMGRSGTTLLDKLLNNHKNLEVISQPFPLLFTTFKKAFLNSINRDKYYVLNDNCFDGDYSESDFTSFLHQYKTTYEDINNIFDKMKNYSGQMTKITFDIPYKENYGFLELYDIILKNNLLNNTVKSFGAKEIMCEEFIPYLIDNDTKVIVIVRDPRDVVASINYPKKEKYLGNKKPTLFILESWRRTIDYIKHFKKNKNFIFLKYEDLVTSPYKCLNSIANFLNLREFDLNHFDSGILDRNGELWKANSSFEMQTSFISSKSVGGYLNVLSGNEINYIETICSQEMDLMGYLLTTIPNKEIIKSFRDNDILESEHLNKNYTSLKENVEKEINNYQNKRK